MSPGLFVSISLGRWWSVLFNHYGGLWGASDDLAMLIGAYAKDVTSHHSASSGAAAMMSRAKNLVLRYTLLSNYLLFMSARCVRHRPFRRASAASSLAKTLPFLAIRPGTTRTSKS